jgi:hypothetical protein
MTHGIRKTMEEMTGHDVGTCPWRAFSDPFVQRVQTAMRFHESGQLAFVEPEPSHKLVEGIAMYNAIDNRVYSKQLDMKRKEQERSRA